jgi:tRNA-modifying protein YgfZ
MVFRADVTIEPAELAVLTLLGPGAADAAVLAVLGLDALPAVWTALPLADGGFVRTLPDSEVDVVVPRDTAAEWRERLVAAGVRPAGVWAYEAHRVAALHPRLGVDTDDRTIPHEVSWIGGPGEGAVHLNKGCYRGQETVARVHNVGKPPRMLVLLHLDGSADRPVTGDPVLTGGKPVGRLGTVVDHVDLGPIGLALLKRGLPADTELTTGGESAVAAVIDADSLPPSDVVGAGRLAIQRLRSDKR